MTATRYTILLLACATLGTIAKPINAYDTASTSASIAPAATPMPTESSAGVDLFDSETVQLTEQTLINTNAYTNTTDVLALFGFENGTDSQATKLYRRGGVCKTFPGDWNYPKSLIWSVFDLLLGGALIKTTPIAAPCYESSGVYNEAKCADISNRFTTADLQ